MLVVECGGNQALPKGQHADRHFHRPGAGYQVPEIALGCGDGYVAQRIADRLGLELVVQLGAQSVGVDVSDVARLESSVFKRGADRGTDALASQGLTGRARLERPGVAQDASQDFCPSGFGVPPLLQDKSSGPFAVDHSVAVGVERSAGGGRIVAALAGPIDFVPPPEEWMDA